MLWQEKSGKSGYIEHKTFPLNSSPTAFYTLLYKHTNNSYIGLFEPKHYMTFFGMSHTFVYLIIAVVKKNVERSFPWKFSNQSVVVLFQESVHVYSDIYTF
jgi:hypothetical protein